MSTKVSLNVQRVAIMRGDTLIRIQAACMQTAFEKSAPDDTLLLAAKIADLVAKSLQEELNLLNIEGEQTHG